MLLKGQDITLAAISLIDCPIKAISEHNVKQASNSWQDVDPVVDDLVLPLVPNSSLSNQQSFSFDLANQSCLDLPEA